MKNMRWLWILLLLLAGGVGSALPTVQAQAPTCIVTVAAPINQYVLPDVNSGSYGPTPADSLSLTVLGRNEASTWYVVQLPNSNPPTYAWISAGDIASTDGNCLDVVIVNPNDVGGSIAAASTPDLTATTSADCTISATQANIREQPSTQAEVVGELRPGVAVAIGRTPDGDWYEVEVPTGRGWIAAIASSQSGDCSALPITSSAVTDLAPCPAGFVGFAQPRVAVGDVGRVLTTASRVRNEPDTAAAIVFQIQTGGEFTIIDGPQCNGGLVWWAVQQGGRTGWLAEADATGTYLIEPAPNTDNSQQFACDPTNPNYRPARVRVGDEGVTVSTAIPSLILFTDPDLNSARLIEVPAGAVLTQVNAGPRCNQNAVFWNVTYADTTGWIVESSTNDTTNDYYLNAPTRTTDSVDDATPANTPPPMNTNPAFAPSSGRITPDTVRDLGILGTLDIANAQQMEWASTTEWIAILTNDAVLMVQYPSLRLADELNGLLVADSTPTAISFDRAGRYLAVGYADGAVRLLDVERESVLDVPPAHTDRISAIAFSIDNALMLTTSGYFYATPPTEFDFSATIYDFTTLNVLDGDIEQLFDYTFSIDDPPLAATFSIEGRPVVLTVEDVVVLDSSGIVQSTKRTRVVDGAIVLPAQSSWFGQLDVVLFASGPAMAAWFTADDVVEPRPVALLNPGVVIAAAQAPPSGGQEPMLAVFASYPPSSEEEDAIRFITPEDNSGIFTGAYLLVTDVLDMAFLPVDGSVLAVLTPTGITFYGLP